MSIQYWCVVSHPLRELPAPTPDMNGGSFFSYSWTFFDAGKLLCLQSLKALIRRTFPL